MSKRTDEGLVAPVVEVTAYEQSVRMEGELTHPSFSHEISAVQVRAGAPPVVMLQSFSGGAHCCTHVQLAGLSQGQLKIVDLGSWDGAEIEKPSDVSGDGIADFVLRDDAFLYAFAAYAMSFAPPKVLNVVNGRVIDVSRNPAFRTLFLESMREAGQVCRSDEDGMTRNGACPAYVASASRVGKLDEAWRQMVLAYDASTDWELPQGCRVKVASECPTGYNIFYKSYPEALLGFLKDLGYVEKGWRPPELRSPEAGPAPIPDTA
ncbi:hypothetical protein [Sphingomonas hankyongi]|uniref:Uncharacterized protein n=1 Tax=Sphingomonas hankyongi TaxID=2908209 RepID=A0ABT0RZZ7_9SPHN|nr:hypothetical protein [Sphingomonas hankyongi]MCL6729183.1 hypothetical protein [Sphingomonas hankyongi]